MPSGDYCEDELDGDGASGDSEIRDLRYAQKQMQEQLDRLEQLVTRQFESVLVVLTKK